MVAVTRAATALLDIERTQNDPLLDRFVTAFERRFGDREVPLTTVLD